MALYRGSNEVDAVFRGGAAVDRLYHGGVLVWPPAVPGPERTATARTQTVGFEGNSQMMVIPGPEHGGQFPSIWGGTVARTFVGGGSLGGIDGGGEVSDSVWAADGPGRNADFSGGGLLCINEGVLPSQFPTGFPAPGTAQDNVTLQYVGGYLREATRIGADGLVIISNYPPSNNKQWDVALQFAQWWRAHATLHNPGNVWVFPLAWLIEDAENYYSASVYSDPVHIDHTNYPALIAAIGHAFEYFCTRALPDAYGSLTGDTLALLDRFMPIIAGYRYAGFGGTSAPDTLLYNGAPLSAQNDPLPSPGALPGEGTAASYGEGQITIHSIPTPPTYAISYGAGQITISEE